MTTSESTCPTGFDQTLLSGALDNELTQADRQRVRLHVEDCEACRLLQNDLVKIREAALDTRFQEPSERQWDEAAASRSSAGLRSAGWIFLVIWLFATAALALWSFATAAASPWSKLLIGAGALGVALLFLSLLWDRLRQLPSDRYRRIQR